MKETVLITGSSRGIGKQTALLFGKQGFPVAVHCRQNREAAEAVAKQIRQNGGQAYAFSADISREEEVKRLFSQIEMKLGEISTLVNNAAVSSQQLFTDLTPQEWDALYGVNLKGTMQVTQRALPGMIRRKAGKVINLSSIWGLTGASCEVGYSVTKAAIIGFTKALAKELGPSNIQVNCVAPGVVSTDMNAHLDKQTLAALKEETPLGRIASPEEIAQTILFLSSPEASFITGQVISPNGGMVI